MSSSLFEQRRYTISDIKLTDPPIPSLKIHKRIFLIEITKIIGGDNEPSKLVEGQSQGKCIVWSEQILYNVTADFTIHFKIFMKKEKNDKSETIGEYTTTIVSDLLNTSAGACSTQLGKKGQLSFAIKEDRFKDMLDIAKQKSKEIHFAEGETWSKFLTYLGIVKTAIDPVAALNPWAQQIWSIVSMVPSILQANQDRTDNIKELLGELQFIYEYIDGADRLSVLRDTQTGQLRLLIDKTCECAKFIKDYTENNSATNLIKGPILNDRISEFKKSFDQIRKNNQDLLLLDIATNMEVFNLLDDLPYAHGVGLAEEKKCLPGTRQTLIKDIEEWVNKDTTERVLILSGQAGTGKSAVAHTIAKNLNDQLGSFFCFSQNNKELFKKSLDPEVQFNEMIIKPSKRTTKRLVIIIDALDESGGQRERKNLLNLLFERSSELPSNYRIIITSRPEDDIEQFHQHPNVHCKYMADIDSASTRNDIQKFVSNELADMAKTLDTVENWRYLLAHQAQDLFICARLTCLHIRKLGPFKARQRLEAVLSKPPPSLYERYHEILDDQEECGDPEYVDMLKKCVGALIVARKPLSVSDLQEFFGPICGDIHDVKAVLKVLNSLFIGIDRLTVKLRPIHASLFDFFLEPKQTSGIPNRYYIDTSDQSYFTDACLRVMNGMLRFNICELETSHKRNRDIPNFETQVAQAIPSCLSYACCYWAYHLQYSKLDDLLGEINNLFHTKLLYLFEVLSLLAEVYNHGRSGMQILISMAKVRNRYPKLASLAEEASQFLFKFGEMMTESTPHLYLSTLPYISKESFISSQYLPQYPHLFSVDVGQPISLEPQFKNSIIQKHPSSSLANLAFSPQNNHIAAGFNNGDLWVWDYITGEMLCQTSPKEKARVRDIVFSLNGELVYCCYKHGGILIWEEKTGNVSYESNEEIAPKECYSCHISPDGRFVAFRTDKAIICYDRETRVKPFEDIPYSTVMFSSTGRFVGIQPKGEVLRLWDTREKTFVSFVSFTKDYQLVALSDNHIIFDITNSEVGDNKAYDIEVYDIQTRTMVCRFQKQSQYLRAGFSPNGEDLFIYHKNECLIWNVSTGKDYSWRRRAFDHHYVYALSSNATHIAVNEHHGTVHVLAWDWLDRDEIDNRSENEDDIDDADQAEAWHKGQHVILAVAKSKFQAGDLRVLDHAETPVLKAATVLVNHRSLAEISPEDNHWSIAYVDINRPSSLCLWNIDEKEVLTIDKSGKRLTIITFSTSGDRLLSCDEEDNIKVWDVRTRTLSSCSRVSSKVTALTFSQTGTTFWVAYQTDEHGFLEERDSESHDTINGPFPHDLCVRSNNVKKRGFYKTINSFIRSIFVSSNDTYICACSESGKQGDKFKLGILDRSTGASIDCFNTLKLPAFSPNRKYIAWIQNLDSWYRKEVKLWDMEKGIIVLYELPYDGWIHMLCFSNDSGQICALASGKDDDRPIGHVTIWDIQTENIVTQCLLLPSSWGTMTLDGDSLFLVNLRGIMRMWDMRVHEIMTRLCSDHINDPQFAEEFGDLQTRRLIEDYKLRSKDTEALDYALTAWNKASFSLWTKSSEDDWMLGPHGELLFWIPREMQLVLWYPGMAVITGGEKLTKLGFKDFVHGTRWTECKK